MGRISDSYVEVMNLVYSYPDRIDSGDFAGSGRCSPTPSSRWATGRRWSEAPRSRRTLSAGPVGTRMTALHTRRHCVTNPIVEIDEDANSAVVRYYITVLQRTDEFALQPVWANKYEDRLERVDGRWRFVRRRGFAHLPGDVSSPSPADPRRAVHLSGPHRAPGSTNRSTALANPLSSLVSVTRRAARCT